MNVSEEVQTDRLVSFLGKGVYQTTTYVFDSREVETEYVACALASMTRAREVVILATDEAWATHGANLQRTFEENGLVVPARRSLPLGQNPQELWQQFQCVVEAISTPAENARVTFDITHGFRSQPFFAAAALDFARSVKSVDVQLQVVYGAFESGRDNRTPIWDLTAFVELLDWSRALLLFLRTGRVDEVAAPTERLGRELAKQWALGGRRGQPPQLRRLGEALQRFGDALVTIRTSSLLCHAPTISAASQLLTAIDQVGDEVQQYLPPLAQVLAMIRAMIEPLVTQQPLSHPDGQFALKSLARLYFRMGRYAEAAATLREAEVTGFASKLADCPGSPQFSREEREMAEQAWFQDNPQRVREIGDLRNDIEHAGYRRSPMPPETIRSKVEDLIERMGQTGPDRAER